ncbi:MAG: amidohydrolase [Demequina sp.]
MTVSPDLVLAHARLSDGSLADVAIRAGVVESIGPAGGEHHGEVVDLEGRYLIPGLWDSHVHFTIWVHNQRRLDVSEAHSASQAAAMVAEQLHADPGATTTLEGFGFRDALWLDVPSGAILDEVAPHRPVVLVAGDYHCVWINTAASHRYGLPHPGLLREGEAFDLQARVAAETPALSAADLQAATARASARGVTGIVDLEMADNVSVWGSRFAAGVRDLRVRAGFYPDMLESMIERGLRTGQAVDGTDGLLTVGSLKVITDGTLTTRTAYCHRPYPDTGDYGLLTVEPEELRALLATARAHGFDAAVHAIGDRANALALDAFEATGAHGSIEHAQLLSDRDIARFARLGVTASVQPEHMMDDRDTADALWAGHTHRAFALASLQAAGVNLALGSDAPVSPLDPWVSMAAAVGRARDDREPWHPEQRIGNESALAASVNGGSIAVGAPADLVVCERDPLSCDADALRTMPVTATLVGGRFTHR